MWWYIQYKQFHSSSILHISPIPPHTNFVELVCVCSGMIITCVTLSFSQLCMLLREHRCCCLFFQTVTCTKKKLLVWRWWWFFTPSSSPPHCLFLGSFGALPFFWLFRCSVFLCVCVCVLTRVLLFARLRSPTHHHTETDTEKQRPGASTLAQVFFTHKSPKRGG